MNFVRLSFCLLFVLFFSSCRKFEQEKIIAAAEPYKITNLHPIERLPKYFNRVAVMPAHYPDPSSAILSYSDEIFLKEVTNVGIFETIAVSTNFCLKYFGKKRLSSSETLPEHFMETLSEQFGADGVMFIDLHSYRPYRPISLGVRSKLVDLKSGEFMWAVDEVLDAGSASVMVSANTYEKANRVQSISLKTNNSVTQSPRLFTNFVAFKLFETLPIR